MRPSAPRCADGRAYDPSWRLTELMVWPAADELEEREGDMGLNRMARAMILGSAARRRRLAT